LLNNVKNNRPAFVTFLFDQCPKVHEIEHWMPFLNQDTPVQTGTEKVAQKSMPFPFIFTNVNQTWILRSRVYLIDENAAQTARFELTEKMNRMLEKIIIEEPEHWLWSHKRWKHKRNQTVRT
jgi:Lauroyl/myristoyl acyltransferase